MRFRLLSITTVAQMALALAPSNAPAFDLITNGLVAYYQLNGNGADSSGNGNNGTLYGTTAATDRFGNAGGALSFSTENDYVSIADPDLGFAATSFTVSAWVRFDVFPTNLPAYGMERDIVRRGNYANYELCTYHLSSNKAELGFSDTSGHYQSAGGTNGIDAGQWSLFTGVYDRSAGTLSVYVNGQLDTALSGVIDPNPSDPYGNVTYIGNWIGTRIWEYPDFVGSIDDVLFYNRALSGTEITSLFDIPEPSAIAGLLSICPLAVCWMRGRRYRGATAPCPR